jgi:hypothetical protein
MTSHRPLRPALAAFLLLAASARAGEPPPIAVLGLRPTEDAAFGATAIAQLAEAQKLRQVVENVIEAASASKVLGHEPLRASLGRAYLVGLFDCKGDAACLLGIARSLRSTGVTTAVAGDYFLAEGVIKVRLRKLDLVREQVAEELIFEVPRDDAGALAPWRAGLAPLFGETGSIRLVVSQPEAACLLDGRACALDGEGTMPEVPEGEHLLVITREGFKKSERVVAVRRRDQTRVAVALEELPVQAQKTPDPNARVPTFEKPTDAPQAKPFGSLRLAISVDDLNVGEREDPFVPAGTRPGHGALTVLPRPAVLGFAIQAPRQESGWQTRGAVSLAWVKDSGPEIDSAFAEIVHEEKGLRLMLGWGAPIVSSLTAGTLTLPEAFGDLSFGGVGLTGTTSFGPILVEAFLGKHKSQFSAGPAVGEAAPLPMGALHVAYVDKERMGVLYGDEFPLTIGLSGLLGQDRVGVGDEVAWAQGLGAALFREQVTVWVASLELYVPFGKTASLAGEAWVGDDVRLLEGAAWQPPRLDLVTGRHRPLRSAGGWAQLALSPLEELELRLVAGTDQAVANLTWGTPIGGEPAIRGNSLVALAAVRSWGQLALGAQVHLVRTTYGDPASPPAVTRGLTFTSQLKF